MTVLSTWNRDGVWEVESIVPYGSSSSENSPHYADQAPLFADGRLKELPLTEGALMEQATDIERPGKPPEPDEPAPPSQ